jgi:hypothetical protein
MTKDTPHVTIHELEDGLEGAGLEDLRCDLRGESVMGRKLSKGSAWPTYESIENTWLRGTMEGLDERKIGFNSSPQKGLTSSGKGMKHGEDEY